MQGVSVVIPVYNGSTYLKACVRSVLAQTIPAAEIILVDDGSEDDTPAVAAQLAGHVRYHRIEHAGLSAARNAGRALARGESLAFMDCDDLWAPEKLEWQLAALSGADGNAMVFGMMQQFISPDLTPDQAAALKCDPTPIPGWSGSVILMRNADFDRAGGFDTSIAYGEFVEWFSRARDAGLEAVLLPQVVCYRRLHMNNMGRSAAARGAGYALTLKKVLDRRRGLACPP